MATREAGLVTLSLALAAAALAGDGPWTLAPGADTLYLGAAYYRFAQFDTGALGERWVPGGGLAAINVHAVLATGLVEGVEVELVVPWESVRVNDRADPTCVGEDLAPDFCRPTSGLGDVSANLKVRMIDELYGSPLTLSLAGGVRSGEAYSAHRARVTTLGDGNTDAGVGLSLGRTDVLGGRGGWYRVGAWGWYWYRFSNVVGSAVKVPADELSYTAEATICLNPRFGFGPAFQGFHRLGGMDFSAWRPASDPWGALAAEQLQLGGKIGVYSDHGSSVSVAVLRTVHARNNPIDTTVLAAGVGWYWPRDKE